MWCVADTAPLCLLSLAVPTTHTHTQMIDMENLLSLLDTPGKVTDAPGAPDLLLGEGAVEFRDVGFGYERGVAVLKGVSVCVGG